jgi:hypothetical protein
LRPAKIGLLDYVVRDAGPGLRPRHLAGAGPDPRPGLKTDR